MFGLEFEHGKQRALDLEDFVLGRKGDFVLVQVLVEFEVGVVGVANEQQVVSVVVKCFRPGDVLQNSVQSEGVHIDHQLVEALEFEVRELVQSDVQDAQFVALLQELGDFRVFGVLQKLLIGRFFEVFLDYFLQLPQTLFFSVVPLNPFERKELFLHLPDFGNKGIDDGFFGFSGFFEKRAFLGLALLGLLSLLQK